MTRDFDCLIEKAARISTNVDDQAAKPRAERYFRLIRRFAHLPKGILVKAGQADVGEVAVYLHEDRLFDDMGPGHRDL